ncbi:hypothetical protein LguiA_020902 [Lonicera macranthoides]
MGRPNCSSTRQKLGNVLKVEKRDLSYADLHSEVMKNVDSNIPPTSSRLHQEQFASTEIKNEELVKHMSKLPSYLERGESLQDKALNVGVLNWGSLERWQYNRNQMPDRNSRFSLSSSNNNTSLFSVEGSSSNHSSRDHSSSFADRKMHRPTLQSPLITSPSEGHSQLKSSVGSIGKFQDFKAVKSNPKPKEFKGKDSEPRRVPEKRTSWILENSGEISSLKEKKKIQDGEFTKEPVNLRDSYCSNVCHGSPETVVLLLPRDDPGKSGSALSRSFYSKEVNGQKPREANRRSFLEGSDTKEFYHKELCSNIAHSKIYQSSSIDGKSVEFASDPPEPSSSFSKISVSPSRSKSLEEKSTITPKKSTMVKSSKGLDMKVGIAEDTKVRNPSPTRWLIMGRMGKSSYSKERAESSACSDNSTNDKPNTAGKARSSPLRRLLDPLLKSKAVDSNQLLDPSQKGSRLTNIDKKNGPSTVQALLQVAIKNGLPLFTFAVDNCNDVLAATVRGLSSSRKDDSSWIYTFFTVSETKKKNGSWLNQRGKGHSYVPNVVAQMKVSDPSFNRVKDTDRFSIKEFVLFAAELRPLDQQTSHLESNDELAAIVVKIPRKPLLQSYDFDDVSAFGVKDLHSTTVILPGGVHGLPNKGEPSPLIERWMSGGSCDCGGWDLGCRVRVLANRTQSSSTCSDRFQLFSQGESLEDSNAVFNLSSFQSGIFSVEFNSSLSLLQAFAICIAVVDSRKPSVPSEMTNFSEEKSSEKTTFSQNERINMVPNQVQVEGPTRYASNPPHSPVERV